MSDATPKVLSVDCHKCAHYRAGEASGPQCGLGVVIPSERTASSGMCGKFTTTASMPTLPLLEAARCMLAEFGCVRECRVEEVGNEPVHFLASGEDSILHGPEYIPAVCPACALRSAIAAEEEREKVRKGAAQAIMAHIAHESGQCPYSDDVIRWAKMETSR